MNTHVSIEPEDERVNTIGQSGELQTEEAENIAEVLRNAPMATLLMEPVSSNAQRLEDLLLEATLDAEQTIKPRKRARSVNALQSLRSTISAFAADLVLHSSYEPSLGFCYRSLGHDTLRETVVAARQFDTVIAIWETLGLVEVFKGFQGTEDFDGEPIKTRGWATRFRATPKLIAMAERLGITACSISDHFRAKTELSYPIELRAKKKSPGKGSGKRLRVDRSRADVRRLASEVREFNEFLNRFDINLATPPSFRRIFNNGDQPDFDWNKGGRLFAYGRDNYQQQSSEYRSKITIDGEPTVELDIRSSQLTIAYGLVGESLPEGDLYAIPGVPREIVKTLVAAIIGKGIRPSRWPSEFAKDYLKKNNRKIGRDFKLSETVDLVIQKHPILGRLKASGIDVYWLQYVESQILLRAILRLLRESEIPSLPVHDCLIVRARDKDTVEEVLKEEFYSEVGIFPTITLK